MRFVFCTSGLAIMAVLAGCAPNRTTRTKVGPQELAFSGTNRTAEKNLAMLPGRKPDGSVLLPNQWSLRPAGQQVELGDFPVNMALHPGGQFVAVLHCGFSAHQILVVDLTAARVVSRTLVHEAFYGIAFSKDGKKLFCSGAGDEVLHSFDFLDGELVNPDTIKLRDPTERGVPSGFALDSGAGHIWVANVWADRVSRIDLLPQPKVTDLPLESNASGALTPPRVSAPDLDAEAATKRDEAELSRTNAPDTFPYTCVLDQKTRRLYVSLWGQAAVAVIDVSSGKVLAHWPSEEHPCEMALSHSGKLLFVANASRNTVTVFDTQSGRALETIWAALYPHSPPGSTPNSLVLSPDERTLFVANADNNTVAVFDVSTPSKTRSLGFIPVGWYPTSVRVTPDGKHLLVANGKGISSQANPLGPQPGMRSSSSPTVQYIARLFRGTLSIIDLPSGKELEKGLKSYTAQAYQCSPLRVDADPPRARSVAGPVPAKIGETSPIQYCLYIIKENRTYDQVLGDMPQGNGDTNLCLFPERVTPNHHKLAREFVLLDNFYVDSEVSADGHEWSMGAYATDFVEKMWPMNYGHNRSRKFAYPSEGLFPIAKPAGGYLWDRAREAGVSYRSYGEFVANGAWQAPATARVAALRGHIDEWYRGFDLSYPDAKRADRFIAELKRFEGEGKMPRLQILRLPNDHTQGVTPGARTPTALVGDNDMALGRIVEAVSGSKFWPQTAIFVVEDDAQNGPDHVDAHRTVAYVISPYTRRGAVDSTMYSTSSMLRTIELILGLKPMSQFDAAAMPMYNSFQLVPNLSPYRAEPAGVDLAQRNGEHAWGNQIPMNFTREDAVDDLLLNEVIWRSIRGRDKAMPAPVRAGFVFAHQKDEDD